MKIDLPWMVEAAKYVGLKEIPGKQHNGTIMNWLVKLGAWWRDDETPWCGVFVGYCIKSCGIKPPAAWYRAKAWASWGSRLAAPAYGCIVVFERQGGGHVGFVIGRDKRERLVVLGGNQGDTVSIAPFLTSRVVAYVWPPGQPFVNTGLPLLEMNAASSINEA